MYLSLHTYVRARLHDKYGAMVPERGPIPAHLLGNLWQQDWSNIYDLVAPPGDRPVYSLTENLKSHKIEPLEMVRIGERFFTSLGFAPLPKTFWERSLFVKPRDREVVCHASAWNIDTEKDVRIKMCIDVNAEDFTTIHHELGHNFYQLAYNTLPVILRDSANDGFHEAVGDTLALSVTPEYLVKIGLLDKAPDASADTGLLLKAALERLAFLPFGLLVDQWRWQVFSGKVTPANLQPRLVGLEAQIPGRRAANAARGRIFRPGREVPRSREHSVRALLPRADSPVPVPPCAIQDGGMHRAAPSLLDLQQQRGRRQTQSDAGDGRVKALARCARGPDRPTADGRQCHGRILRAAQDVARSTESREDGGVVGNAEC